MLAPRESSYGSYYFKVDFSFLIITLHFVHFQLKFVLMCFFYKLQWYSNNLFIYLTNLSPNAVKDLIGQLTK